MSMMRAGSLLVGDLRQGRVVDGRRSGTGLVDPPPDSRRVGDGGGVGIRGAYDRGRRGGDGGGVAERRPRREDLAMERVELGHEVPPRTAVARREGAVE